MEKCHTFSHHEHVLELKNYHKRYTCDGCKETGFGPRYRCERCKFNLHKDCMLAPVFSPIQHEFFKESSFKFHKEPPESRHGRFCDACSKQIKGYVYHCEKRGSGDKRYRGWDLHPCCYKLPMELPIQKVKLRLRNKIVSDCLWCKSKHVKDSKSGIRGWSYSYESKCGDYHYHVHCAKEMMVEGWKNGAYIKDNGKNIDSKDEKSNNKLMVSENLKLPIQAGSKRGRRSKKLLSKVKFFLKTMSSIISLLLGNPVPIIADVIAAALIPS